MQLNSFGMIAERDYYVNSFLNDLRIIDELETIKQRMLFTSGSPNDVIKILEEVFMKCILMEINGIIKKLWQLLWIN